MFRASLFPSSGEQRPPITAYGICASSAGTGWLQLWGVALQVAGIVIVTVRTVIRGFCSPDDGHKDARNMLRQ